MFKELWHHSKRETDRLPHSSACSKLGFLFQKRLWFISIIIKTLMLHVQTVMILPSCESNTQLSCVFSVSNTVSGAEKDKSTDIWLHTRHLLSLRWGADVVSGLQALQLCCCSLRHFYCERCSTGPSVMFYSDDSTWSYKHISHRCSYKLTRGNSFCSQRAFTISFYRRKIVLKQSQTSL